jgi:biopolymer transport protein ExbB
MKRQAKVSRAWTALAGISVVAAALWMATQPAWPQAPAEAETPLAAASAEPVVTEEPIPTKDLWSIIREGGLLMIPIGFCSLIMVALIFERTISLRRGRVIPKPFVTRFIQQALALCEESGSPVAEVFAGAVRKWGRPAVEVEQAIIDAGERATNGLRRYLRVFNGVATVSPLLGLLGTVTGMIRAFNAIATSDALGRPELLANGISEALLTTAAGLSVAIPALICYMLFVSRVDRLIIDIDARGQQIVNLISAEEFQARNQKVRAPKSKRALAQESAV